MSRAASAASSRFTRAIACSCSSSNSEVPASGGSEAPEASPPSRSPPRSFRPLRPSLPVLESSRPLPRSFGSSRPPLRLSGSSRPLRPLLFVPGSSRPPFRPSASSRPPLRVAGSSRPLRPLLLVPGSSRLPPRPSVLSRPPLRVSGSSRPLRPLRPPPRAFGSSAPSLDIGLVALVCVLDGGGLVRSGKNPRPSYGCPTLPVGVHPYSPHRAPASGRSRLPLEKPSALRPPRNDRISVALYGLGRPVPPGSDRTESALCAAPLP